MLGWTDLKSRVCGIMRAGLAPDPRDRTPGGSAEWGQCHNWRPSMGTKKDH